MTGGKWDPRYAARMGDTSDIRRKLMLRIDLIENSSDTSPAERERRSHLSIMERYALATGDMIRLGIFEEARTRGWL
jgi:hypothetical protein